MAIKITVQLFQENNTMKKLKTLMQSLFFMLVVQFALIQAVSAESVQIKHDGLLLNANLVKADDNWPQGPVMLMTHGTLAHGQMEIMASLQTMFEEMGVSSLSISLSLGLSDRTGMYDCATPHKHKHTDAVTEIGLWHDWLKQQGVEKVALLGHSRGGNQIARFAAQASAKDIVKVYLVAPAVSTYQYSVKNYKERYKKDLEPLLKKAQSMVAAGKGNVMMKDTDFIYCEKTQATAEAFVNYYQPDTKMDTTSLIASISYPVTIFAGSEDKVVKNLIPKAEKVVNGESSNLVVIQGSDHFFRDLYAEEIVEMVVEELESL